MNDPIKRRVLVLNHFAAPRGHAGGTRHVEMFGRLNGWDHLILAGDRNYLTDERVTSSPGLRAVPVTAYQSNGWKRILNWLTYALNAFLIGLRQPRLDVVYASSPHLLTPMAGWALARLRRRPFVLEVRDLWPQVLVEMGQLSAGSTTHRILVWLEKFLYEQAAAIVVMAEGSLASIEKMGVSPRKIVYIPNGADPDDFQPSAPREELRRRFGFTRFTATYAGAHGPANGLELLLEAASHLRDQDLELVLVGGGVSKESLQQEARRRGLTNVRFLDPVPKTDMPDLLSASDVGLHVLADVELFRTAVSPNKLFDYMAAQLPILTNCPGDVADLVAKSGSGITCDPRGLAEGLVTLLATPSLVRNEMGARGRAWLAANQSRSIMVSRLEELLDKQVR